MAWLPWLKLNKIILLNSYKLIMHVYIISRNIISKFQPIQESSCSKEPVYNGYVKVRTSTYVMIMDMSFLVSQSSWGKELNIKKWNGNNKIWWDIWTFHSEHDRHQLSHVHKLWRCQYSLSWVENGYWMDIMKVVHEWNKESLIDYGL